MPLQAFVDNSLPTIKAAWLNAIDAFYFTLFNSATTAAQARTALGSTTVGDALFIAASAAAARTTLDVPSNAEAILDTLIDAKGDLLVGTAADTVARLAVGTVNGQTLQVSSGATEGVVWGYNAVVQRAYGEYLTNADLTTALPVDDTIPQITEGTEIITVAITPKSASNRIRIRVCGVMSGANTAGGALALFADATANALTATVVSFSTAAPTLVISFEYEESAASTTARTYRLRAGGTATVRMNGGVASRYFGGVARTTMVIEEIA